MSGGAECSRDLCDVPLYGAGEWRAGEDVGSERDEAAGNGEDCIMRSSLICTAEQILFGLSSKEVYGGQGM